MHPRLLLIEHGKTVFKRYLLFPCKQLDWNSDIPFTLVPVTNHGFTLLAKYIRGLRRVPDIQPIFSIHNLGIVGKRGRLITLFTFRTFFPLKCFIEGCENVLPAV